MLCGPNLKNSSDMLLSSNMLLIPGYSESLEEIVLLCLKKSWGFPSGSSMGKPDSGAGDTAAA